MANKTTQSDPPALDQLICKRIVGESKNKPMPTAARRRLLQRLEELKTDLSRRQR